MGYAHGLLVKDRMIGLVETFWAYMEKEIVCFSFIIKNISICIYYVLYKNKNWDFLHITKIR